LRKTGNLLKKIKDINSGSNKFFKIIKNNWAVILILKIEEMDSEEIIIWEMFFELSFISFRLIT
jgi:predicted transcriptional regulator